MKELDSKNKIELSVKKEQEKKKELAGLIYPKKGHIVFEINLNTGKISPAEFTNVTVFQFGKEQKKQILMKEKCCYISALNKKNALKIYRRNLLEYARLNQ